MNKKVFLLTAILIIICVGMVTISEGFSSCIRGNHLDGSGNVITDACTSSQTNPAIILIGLLIAPLVLMWNRGLNRGLTKIVFGKVNNNKLI